MFRNAKNDLKRLSFYVKKDAPTECNYFTFYFPVLCMCQHFSQYTVPDSWSIDCKASVITGDFVHATAKYPVIGYTGCLQLAEILEISGNLKLLLVILEMFWDLVDACGKF